jgi:3-oxoacyl-[acyl-carrier-protein] synthase III
MERATSNFSVAITGTGMAVPPRVVTNHDLAKLMDTSDEWIRQRTGIEERRYVDAGVGPADLAFEAAGKALRASKLEAKDVDFVLVASLSPQQYFPGTCSFLQAKLGMGTKPGLDIRAQCSGFIYGLELAQSLIMSGQYQRILLVGVEVQSVALDLSNRGRDTATLFGDAAGAVILERSKNLDIGIKRVITHLEGQYADKLGLRIPSAVGGEWVRPDHIADGAHSPYMDGRFVFKHAVTRMPEVIGEVLKDQKLNVDDIDLWLFHQANLRINEHICLTLRIPDEKVYNNIQKYGNTSAATIPTLLDECVRSGRLKPGAKVMTTAFGAGFTWGAALVVWGN